MSKKKKATVGNPAKRAMKKGTALEEALLDWAETFVLHGDVGQAKAAAAVTAWVGASDPGRTGINQCVNACYQLHMVLDAVDVPSVIVPVTLQLLTQPRNGKLIGAAGSPAPAWSDGYRYWSGHAVLYLPTMGRILDPTIGQAIPTAKASDQIPLLGKVMAGTPAQATQPGRPWYVGRAGHFAEYRVLDPHYSPLANYDVVKILQDSTAGLRDRLPHIVTSINAMLRARPQRSGV